MIAVVFQSGLGIPGRDYYLRDDERSKNISTEYVAHVAAMLRAAGENVPAAAADAKTIMALETERRGAPSFSRIDVGQPESRGMG